MKDHGQTKLEAGSSYPSNKQSQLESPLLDLNLENSGFKFESIKLPLAFKVRRLLSIYLITKSIASPQDVDYYVRLEINSIEKRANQNNACETP